MRILSHKEWCYPNVWAQIHIFGVSVQFNIDNPNNLFNLFIYEKTWLNFTYFFEYVYIVT